MQTINLYQFNQLSRCIPEQVTILQYSVMSYSTSPVPRKIRFSRPRDVEDFLGNLDVKRRTALEDTRPVLELLISARFAEQYVDLLKALKEATRMSTVQEVRLQIVPGGSFAITAEFLAAVFASLNQKLVSFESGCSFAGENRKIATDALQNFCPLLREVDIYERDEKSLVTWIQAIQTSPALTKIEVGSSEMGKICMEALSNLLLKNRNSYLKELKVVCFRKDIDLSPLAEGLRGNTTLSELCIDLSFCNIYPHGSVANSNEIKTFEKALEHDNYSLKRLEVGGASYKILFYLKLNQIGRDLLLRSGKAKEQDWIDIILKNKGNTSIVYYFLRKNPALCGLVEDGLFFHQRPCKKSKT